MRCISFSSPRAVTTSRRASSPRAWWKRGPRDSLQCYPALVVGRSGEDPGGTTRVSIPGGGLRLYQEKDERANSRLNQSITCRSVPLQEEGTPREKTGSTVHITDAQIICRSSFWCINETIPSMKVQRFRAHSSIYPFVHSYFSNS